MNFFIDFEATQFTNEIISIGCVSENGNSFYSEVNCEGEITPFITNLTGLTAEQIYNAPTANSVFVKFYIWLNTQTNYEKIPKFYVFGNSDEIFLKATLNKVTDATANLCLSLILGNLIDYSKQIKKRFHLHSEIGLVKLLESYKKTPIEQTHNALQDAFFLQEVFNFVKNDESSRGPVPEKYYKVVTESNDSSEQLINTFKGPLFANKKKKKVRYNFNSMKEAVEWVIEQQPEAQKKQLQPNNIAKKIAKAIRNKEKYMCYDWRRG